MADANCEVAYTIEEDCCNVDLAAGVQEPPPVEPPPPPPPVEPDNACPYYCGLGSPEGVQISQFDSVDVSGGEYLQLDSATTSHPWWAKFTVGGTTGWKPWAGLGSDGVQSYRIGDNSLASGDGALSFGKASLASGLRAVAIGESTIASGARAEAFGYNSNATADDAKAFGSGAIVSGVAGIGFGVDANVDSADGIGIGQLVDINAVRGIGIGKGSRVDFQEGISIGDGATKNANDISVGWGHALGRANSSALLYPNIIIGKGSTITGADDPSASTQSGGHVLIGIGNTAPFDKTNWPNVVVGHTAKSAGHAAVVIGHLAESRAVNTPISGQAEGRFAVIIGYAAKGSGGCIVAVGDQADVRGDNAAAVGTHARANDPSTAAFGPSAFAGSVTSDNSGAQASAFGVSAQATAGYSQAFGSGSTVNAGRATALGPQVFISSLLEASVGIGHGATPVFPRTVMIGGAFTDGYEPITAIHFNGSSTPAIIVNPDGTIRINDNVGVSTSQQLPLTADVTLAANERTMLMDSSSGAKTVTLPLASAVAANTRVFVQKVDSSGNAVSVSRQGTDTLDGGTATFDLTSQYKYAILKRSSATNWNVDENN